jgi:O-antigen/teichoic acid export membrane protein
LINSGKLKKIGAITGVDAVGKVISYIVLPYYLAKMPTSEFGEFSYLSGGIASLSLLLSLYVFVPFIKIYTESEPTGRTDIIRSASSFGFLWVLFLLIIIILIKPLSENLFSSIFSVRNLRDSKYYLSAMLVCTGVAMIYLQAYFIALQSTKRIIIFTAAKTLLTITTSVLVLRYPIFSFDTVLNRLIGNLCSEVVLLFLSVIFLFQGRLIVSTIDHHAIRFLRLGMPLIPTGVMSLYASTFDKSLIANWHGLSDLACYNLALQTLTPIQMLMTGLQVIIAPTIFKTKSNKDALKEVKQILLVSGSAMLVAGGLIAVLMQAMVFLEMVPSAYSEVPEIIILLTPGSTLLALQHLNNNMFTLVERPFAQLLVSVVSVAINFLFNILLVKEYSYYGAATALVASGLFSLIFGWSLIRNMVK